MLTLAQQGARVFPIFEEMQRWGMPASRKYFQKLALWLDKKMDVLLAEMSREYNYGIPYNPNSSSQTYAILRGMRVKLKKKTAKGAISTSKDAIEHLRHSNPFVARHFQFKELNKRQNTFCRPLL